MRTSEDVFRNLIRRIYDVDYYLEDKVIKERQR